MKRETTLASIVLIAASLCLSGAYAAESSGTDLRVSPDGRFLMQPDGEPFFWLADTGWSLFQRLDRADTELYLSDRAAKGYNVIQAVAFGGPADLPNTPNRYGQQALIDGDPTRPNPKYFEHIDWVVERASRLGLRVGMLPTWGCFVIGGWLAKPQVTTFTPESAREYGRWLGQRYRGKGIVWILGGDTNPIGITKYSSDESKRDVTLVDHRPIYDALAQGIIEGDGGKPVITYHMTCCSWPGVAQPQTSNFFGDRPWLTLNMLQSSHYRDGEAIKRRTRMENVFSWSGPYNYVAVRQEYESWPTRPVIDGEPRYEDLGVDSETDPNVIAKKGYWTSYDARNAAYHAVFAGAAGHTYGNHSVWQFYDPKHFKPVHAARVDVPWQKAIQRDAAGQMQHLKALMLSRPYFSRVPDQSLVMSHVSEGESYVSATRDRSGSYAMVFTPKGQAITVDLTKVSGLNANAWWFDPRTGVAKRIDGTFPTNSVVTFTPPSSGPTNDWVLVVDDASKNFSAPGAGNRQS